MEREVEWKGRTNREGGGMLRQEGWRMRRNGWGGGRREEV